MQDMYIRLTWLNILIENPMIFLMWNINDLAHGHRLDMKSKINGMGGVLEELEYEIWDYISSNEGGPFERPGEDPGKWADYVNAKRAVLAKKISNIQSRILEVQDKMDSLSEDGNAKIPAGDKSETKDTSSGSYVTIKDISQALRRYLHALKNWSAYLEDVKTNGAEEVPIDQVHEIMTELESKSDRVDPEELVKMNNFLTKNARRNPKVRKNDSIVSCNETDPKIGQVLRQVQKNFSETFLYRNITLKEINQMSKIIDFVERYRGQVQKMFEPEAAENETDEEVPMEKKLSIVDALDV